MSFRAPKIVGIVNLTEDSFSDGGLYLQTDAAIARCLELVRDGADILDLGAASSNPDAKKVAPADEILRLEPVVDAIAAHGTEASHATEISIDTFKPEVQRWAAARDIAYLNDIRGFPDPSIYTDLARARCRLVVMHSIQRSERATRVASDAPAVIAAMYQFFEERIGALTGAGVARERLILDPGMGYFLGSSPEPSILALSGLAELRARFGLPILVSVSRKSFLGAITGRDVAERGAATLAAEIHAALSGADFIRTHDARQLRDAIKVIAALESAPD
ncbi:MAG TPA: dihydropteroate synthase [Candidatus Binataceae bacterium]